MLGDLEEGRAGVQCEEKGELKEKYSRMELRRQVGSRLGAKSLGSFLTSEELEKSFEEEDDVVYIPWWYYSKWYMILLFQYYKILCYYLQIDGGTLVL